MKKILLAFLLLVLSFFAAADHRPVEDTLEVETTVTDNEYRYYADEDKVGYIARVRRNRVNDTVISENIYKNISISHWTAMQGNDAGTRKIGEIMERELGSANHTFTLTGHDTHYYLIEITYNTNSDYSYTYEELEEVVPDDVEATVHYEGYTNTAVIPVETRKADVNLELLGGETSAQTDNRSQQENRSKDKTEIQDRVKLRITSIVRAVINWLPL